MPKKCLTSHENLKQSVSTLSNTNNAVRRKIKTIDPKLKEVRKQLANQWPDFFSQTTASESQTSKSSKSSDSNDPSINGCHQKKSRKAKKESRFRNVLAERPETQIIKLDDMDDNSIDPFNNFNDSNNANTDHNPYAIEDEMLVVSEPSSPVRSAMPVIDSHSSPIRPLTGANRSIDKKESISHIIDKSIDSYLKDALRLSEKTIYGNKSKKSKDKREKPDTTLREMTLNKLKLIESSRQEFRLQKQSQKLKSKPLVLTINSIETECGNSILYSIVSSNDNEEYAENTPILLLLNQKIVNELDQTSKYRVNLFPKWSSSKKGSRIYIYNAFNIEFEKMDEQVMHLDEIRDSDCEYTTIWTKEHKWLDRQQI